MKTSRFTVATLLMAGFGIVCLFLAATIALGLSEQAKLNRATASIADDRWPKIELLTRVRLRVTDIAVSLRNVMLSDSPAVRSKQVASIAASRKEVQDTLQALSLRMNSDHGQMVLAKMRSVLETYGEGQQQLIDLVQAGRDSDARDYLNQSVKPMLQACRDVLSAEIQYEVELMNGAREDAAQAYSATQVKMLALGAVALLVSVVVATAIITRLRRSLGGEPEVAAQTAARIADGDLTGAIALRANDRSSMMYEMEHMRDELGRLVGQVRRDTDQIASASAQIAAGNLDLSNRTEQQAASLEETAAAMEQLSATVEQNTSNAEQANRLALQASQAAERGGAAVAAVTTRMHDIADATRQMADIIGLINGISFQTNILALNAAVEAARAGDAGRGFAVVAQEVRQLAHRSADAAKQISALIASATEQANAGAALVQQTGDAMRDIVDTSAKVEDIMAQIRHASAEQHAGIVSCSSAVVAMDEGTQQNAALVEQVAAAAQSLQDQSEQLAQAVSRFHIDGVDGSAPEVAAASAAALVQRAAASAKAGGRTSTGARLALLNNA